MPTGIDSAAGQQNTPGHGFRPGSDKPYAEPKGTQNETPQKSQNFRATKPDPKDGGSFHPPGAGLVPGFGGGPSKPNQEDSSKGNSSSQNQQQAGQSALKNKLQDVAEKVKESKGDPRKVAAALADEYLHLGAKVGSLLVAVWLILSAVTTVGGFIIGGIPATIILNILLFSPKTVYNITKYIIDLIPVVGEVAIEVEKIGLDKLEITIKGWQKGLIIAYDLIVGAIIILVCIIAFSAFCYALQTPSAISNYFGGTIVTNNAGSAIDKVLPIPIFSACSQITGLGNGGDFGGGGATDNFGGGTNIPNPGAGKCVDVEGNGVTCSAGCVRKDPAVCNHQFDAFIKEASQLYGVDVNIIRSIIQQESQFRPNLTSPAGANGLMQIIPSTWNSIGCTGSYFDPRSNILCGTKYLKNIMGVLTSRDGSAVGSNLRYISAAYNAGPGTVGRSGNPGSGPFAPSPYCSSQFQWECAFGNSGHTSCSTNGWKETRNYSVSVESYYQTYSGGSCPIN